MSREGGHGKPEHPTVPWWDNVPSHVGDARAATLAEVGCQPGDLPLHLSKALARSYHRAQEWSRRLFGHGKGETGSEQELLQGEGHGTWRPSVRNPSFHPNLVRSDSSSPPWRCDAQPRWKSAKISVSSDGSSHASSLFLPHLALAI